MSLQNYRDHPYLLFYRTFKGNRTKAPITQYSLGSISLVVYEKIFSEKKIEM
jgi:hypothetical protein